ncbi:solute carrier family 15 member 4-like [Lingula anatina]|uniref:Solute carrier family 15 member 4-like n=1 Tax=Lingula anatina TaxID=7574 RepID=A0A1S3J3T1_LINAN|nr:solute carrier family 15 member 4-like [Lingula anatina]|eukprot:XP_013404524.1 solute carrier family 15 member 4-like [Lingula anatina]
MAFSKSALLVLLALMCERAVYFTVENYVNDLWTKASNSSNTICDTLQENNYTTNDAVFAHMMFVGASACFGIFGGAFADAFLHPIPTLGAGYVVLSIGLVLLEYAAYEAETNPSAARDLVLAGLATTGLGHGCIGAVLPVVGAAQVPDKNNRRRFIHWYYVWRNVGAIIADTSRAVFVQYEIEFYIKYLIAPVSGALSDILVLAAILVRKKPPEENPPHSTCNEGTTLPNVLSSAFQLCRKGCLLSTSYRGRENMSRGSNLRAVLRILLVNSAVVGFGFLYFPMITLYELQAFGLNGTVAGHPFPSPSTQLILFNEVVVVFVIPFTLYCLYPRICPRGGPHYITKTCIGMVFSVISGFVAIMLETVRKKDSENNHGYSTISIFAQGPQYSLIALAEVFTELTVMEYSYMEAPDGIKCFSMGLHQAALGLSYLIAVGIEALVRKTRPDWHLSDLGDICGGDSQLESFLGILVLLSVVFSLIFPMVTRIPKKRPGYTRLR